MTSRVVNKQLAGHEDLLFGRGSQNQPRQGSTYPITKLSLIWVVESLAELANVNYNKHPMVLVIDGTEADLFEHVAGTGWVSVRFKNKPKLSTGSFYLTTTTVTTIVSETVPTALLGTTTSTLLDGFSHVSGRLRLTEGPNRVISLDASIAVDPTNNDKLAFYFAIDGVVQTSTKHILPVGSRTLSMHAPLFVAVNQELSVHVANEEALNNVEALTYSMSAQG